MLINLLLVDLSKQGKLSLMAESITKLQVFISGPGDTLREQELVVRTIRSMNQSQMKYLGITLQSLSWREDLRADFGIYAQDVVNKQFGEEWDIYVGVLWARHGTPTPKAQSGTEEEFDLAYKRWKADNTSCKVAVFFSEAPISPLVDAEQLRKVQAFRRKVEASGGVYTTFADAEDFIFKVRDYLSDMASSYGRDWGITAPKPVRKPSYLNGQPTIGFLSFSEMNVMQVAVHSITALMTFMLTLGANMTILRNLTKKMREQIDMFPRPQTKAEGKIWIAMIKRKISEAFLGASVEIEGNLPKVREAWGNLSSIS